MRKLFNDEGRIIYILNELKLKNTRSDSIFNDQILYITNLKIFINYILILREGDYIIENRLIHDYFLFDVDVVRVIFLN